ncbi:MAG: hypothetical protein SFY56_00420 [Bacteroidota bacterium]|nr:hypothetical protein [Bacteroidota bacterium]
MKKNSFVFSLITLLLTTFILSCKKKKAPTCDGTSSSYNSNIKSILNNSCTSSGCHPSYSSYSGIKSILDNGSFKNEVITKKSMPKGNSLSSDQLSKIQCWIDAGYPEN